MKKLFSMKSEVKKFLIKHPVLRDNDNRLMANIWYNHIKNITFINGKDVLRMIATGKLPSPASITRCRRKIQEENIHLRGDKWIDRQERAKKIRKEIVT